MEQHDYLKSCQKEAIRLFDVSSAILEEMKQEKDFLPERADATFSVGKIKDDLAGADEEKRKLEALEFVVAVVGTMKAGKSTVINAIIGDDILPNRNTAMTSLPTRIRHREGQKEPILTLPDAAPVQKLLNLLQPKIQSTLNNNPPDSATGAIWQGILDCKAIRTEYLGSAGIFSFLSNLNDLARTCRDFDVEFPYEDFDTLSKLPLIEVEFSHLAGLEPGNATFTLLDTPGPNEAGQTIMRRLMREQLKKASALITVLDYTQLKSEADEEVRNQVAALSDTLGDRLYVLVNKFDAKDSNSFSAEDTKAFVSQSLLEGVVVPETVFPVSAKWAFFANRARKALKNTGQMPDPRTQPWAEDFLREAFGRRWECDPKDTEKIQKGVDFLWGDSLFSEPLKKIIHAGYTNAAILSVEAARGRLKQMEERLSTFVANRAQLLQSEVQDIHQAIATLKGQIHELHEGENEIKEKKDVFLNEFSQDIKEALHASEKELRASVEKYFKEGKTAEADRIKSQTTKKQSKSFMGFFSAPIEERDFDPDEKVLTFSERSIAQDFMKKIGDSIEVIARRIECGLLPRIEEGLQSFEHSISKEMLRKGEELLGEISSSLSEKRLSFRFTMPSTRSVRIDFDARDFLDGAVECQERQVTRRRRQSGIWGGICSFFNTDDWGWEDYTTSEKYFSIDISRLKEQVTKSCKGLFDGVDSALQEYVAQPLEKGIDAFFTEFSTKLSEVNGDLEAAIHDSNKEKSTKDRLIRRAGEILTRVEEMRGDIEQLAVDATRLKEPVTDA